MNLSPLRALLAPLWLLSVATQAKSFRDNPVIGSRRLNAWGLHAARVSLAHRMARARRERLAERIPAGDRQAFERDGYIIRHAFLPEDEFALLRDALLRHQSEAREMVQGDTVTRRIALDAATLKALPEAARVLQHTDWRTLIRYVGSFDQEPLVYIQTILNHVRAGAPDPQTHLHADTFHPSVKAWLFLTDVPKDGGPFVYVPGSHILTPARLAWERRRSLEAASLRDKYSASGSFRIERHELAALGLGEPRCFAVPANTLVIADTFGFHARGPSTRPCTRIELWAYGRRNPFLPWTGLAPLSWPPLAVRRIPWLWRLLDLREQLGGRRNPWRRAGSLRPDTPYAGMTPTSRTSDPLGKEARDARAPTAIAGEASPTDD